MPSTTVTCPNCEHTFAIEDALADKLRKELEIKYQKEVAAERKKIISERKALESEKEAYEAKVNEMIAKEKKRLRKEIEDETAKEYDERVRDLEEESAKRRKELQDYKKKEVDMLRREKDLKDKEEEMRLALEKEMIEREDKIKTEIRKHEEEKVQMKFKEYEKKLDDQKRLNEEMQRKLDQGSMQMQGEVQELALEELLRDTFPTDTIEEVSKGKRGADVQHRVCDERGDVCGTIIYESKRTKNFSRGWIEKLKDDMREAQADIGVIVTEAMPDELERAGEIQGVWICSFPEAKSVALILREMLLRIARVKSAGVNKGEKMEMLYAFLTGEEFRRQVESIVESFSEMTNDLDKEKRAMQRLWKTREKQIEKVIANTCDMYGAIKGIAGNTIQAIPALELSGGAIEE